jgi:phosphoglycolate phosphatase
VRKPDAGGLRLIAERWGLAVAELLLVGDSAIDAATAAAAGIPLVLVGWGYGSVPQLAGLGAPRVDDAAGLLAALR